MINLLNTKVKHKAFGMGTILEQSEKMITVQFVDKSRYFQYPEAFEAFLVAEDDGVRAEIQAEKKAVEEAAAEAKAVADAALEKARLEQMEQQAMLATPIKARAYVPVQRKSGQPQPYLVFQGATFSEEYYGQFIWAPKANKDGRKCHHWDRLMDVRAGDVLFHCADSYIQAISIAQGPCEDCLRPKYNDNKADLTQWELAGRKVSCSYIKLDRPLQHSAYRDKIIECCRNVKYAPFRKDGRGNTGYLFDLNIDLAVFFMKKIVESNPEIRTQEQFGWLLD